MRQRNSARDLTQQSTTNRTVPQRRKIKKQPIVKPTMRTAISALATMGSMASLALSPVKIIWLSILSACISLISLCLGQVVAFIGNSQKRKTLGHKKSTFNALNSYISVDRKRELEANSCIDEIGLTTMPTKAFKESCQCGPICKCLGGYYGHPEENYTKRATIGFIMSCLTTGAVTGLNCASTACTIAAATVDDKNPAYQPLFYTAIATRVVAIGLDKAEQHFKARNLDRRIEQYDEGIQELAGEITQPSSQQANPQLALNRV